MISDLLKESQNWCNDAHISHFRIKESLHSYQVGDMILNRNSVGESWNEVCGYSMFSDPNPNYPLGSLICDARQLQGAGTIANERDRLLLLFRAIKKRLDDQKDRLGMPTMIS